MKQEEKAKWKDSWTIEKYDSRKDFEKGKPYEVVELKKKNIMLNSGINELWDIVAGDSVNVFSNDKAQIGVGDDDTVAQATQTDLEAATNKTYKGMENTYPQTGSDEKMALRAIFGENDANYDWREFVVKQVDSNICLNRLVSSQGTKASGQVWALNVDITLE